MTMRVLVLYAHPVETSFNAALHDGDRRGAEAGRPRGRRLRPLRARTSTRVLTREERIGYHEVGPNRRAGAAPMSSGCSRPRRWCSSFPVWNFGYPAILKGFFDRVFLPGVSFELTADGGLAPKLQNIRKLAAVCTYGGSRFRAMLAGDPPRKAVTRVLRAHDRLRHPAPISPATT